GEAHRRAIPAGALLLVVAAAMAAYLPALANGFVWDDSMILERELPRIGSVHDLLFPKRDAGDVGWWYYRPLVFSTYLADWRVGGGSPIAFHVTPILLHGLVTGLLFLLLWELLDRRAIQSGGGARAPAAAMLGALLFAIHPVHAEVVAWMAGRAEELAL